MTTTTTYERVKQALRNYDFDDETGNGVDELIAYAYFLGKCEKSKELCDKIRALLEEQHNRANECRYHKMANDIIGKQTFIYDGDYGQWINMFAHDKTEIE